MPGSGQLTITGQLGDVMRESAQAALSWVRGHAPSSAPDLPDDWFATHDLHVHVPAGAVPKDGPSAGVAMATALASLVAAKPVRVGRRDDRRDHADRPGAADRRAEGEVAGRPARRDQAGDRARSETRATIARDPRARAQRARVRLRRPDRERRSRSRSADNRCRRGYKLQQLRPDDETWRGRPMAKSTRATARARRGRIGRLDNPYVRRVIEDEELRDSVRDAFDAARARLDRRIVERQACPTPRSTTRSSSKDLQATAAESLRDAIRSPARQGARSAAGVGSILIGHRRRRARAALSRGPAQGRPRPAVRRRGGVRVHLDDHPGTGARGDGVAERR